MVDVIVEIYDGAGKGLKGDQGIQGVPGGTANFTAAALGDADLNSIVTPGIYSQGIGEKVLKSKNYPADHPDPVVLEVVSLGGWLIQRLTCTSIGRRGIYQRTFRGGTNWSVWYYIPSQRWDMTAGRALYTWDDSVGREQLTYGDTGWRAVPALNGWSGQLQIRRTGYDVKVRMMDLSGVSAVNSNLYNLPVGFWSDGWVNLEVCTYSGPSQKLIADGEALKSIATPSSVIYAAGGRFTTVAFTTGDPWPTSLPGTAHGSIPNL